MVEILRQVGWDAFPIFIWNLGTESARQFPRIFRLTTPEACDSLWQWSCWRHSVAPKFPQPTMPGRGRNRF